MYRAHQYATNLYRHELSKGLRALGYRIENHARGFEIKGVPQSVIERFSKRHQQIDEETRTRQAKGEKVGNIKDLRERVAHGNWRRKMKFRLEELSTHPEALGFTAMFRNWLLKTKRL